MIYLYYYIKDIELSKLLEQKEEYRKAAQVLRFANGKIIAYKDEVYSRNVESKKDLFLPFAITCNNSMIKTLIEDMKSNYYQWKAWLRKRIRTKVCPGKG